MGKHNRSRHEFRRLIASKSKHQPLVTCALFFGLFAIGFLGIHTLRDIGALAGQEVAYENAVGVENIIVIGVADPPDRFADNRANVHHRIQCGPRDFGNGDFATYDDRVAFNKGFAGHSARFVDGEAGVKNSIGNGIADFVRMAFADGFRGKNITTGHNILLLVEVKLYVSSYANILIRCMSSIIKSLRALSDPLRLRLMLLLMQEELTVAELQEILGFAQSRISTSLAQLKREDLVRDRRMGKNIFYSASESLGAGVQGVLDAASSEIHEARDDLARLSFTLKKRQDRAADYFNKLAGRFGRAYVPGRSWEALSHALLRLLPPMVIADLGAGEGTLSQLMARNAKKIIAIDNSEKMVEFGASLAKEHGFRNLEYRLGDLEDPPIEADSVDLALFSQALHHAATPQRALLAAHRILRAEGRLIILDLLSHTQEQTRDLYGHVWMGFSEMDLHRMLKKAGFSKIETCIVSREQEAPFFQTLLATGVK